MLVKMIKLLVQQQQTFIKLLGLFLRCNKRICQQTFGYALQSFNKKSYVETLTSVIGDTWVKLLKLNLELLIIYREEGFLSKGNKLCIPRNSLREHITRELHESGLSRHGKRLEHFFSRGTYYWPQVGSGMNLFVQRCYSCETAKEV